MKKIFKYRAAIILILLGVFFDHLSREQDKWHDIELAALRAPVINSNLAWLEK